MPRTPFSLTSYPCCLFAFRVPIARFRDGSSHFRTPDWEPTRRADFLICGIMEQGNTGNCPRNLFFVFVEKALIPRYTRQEMGHVWSDANKFAKWLEVELAATETLAEAGLVPDRKSTRLNSSHSQISYAVFCLKKKNNRHKTNKDTR